MPPIRVVPSIKIVHVCPPIVVHTDSNNFRLVVQKLTGNGKNACEPLVHKRLHCFMASDDDGSDLPLDVNPSPMGYSRSPQAESTISTKLQLQTDQEVSTCSTSCSDDSLQGVTSTFVDPRQRPPHSPPLKRLRFGVSSNRESSNCKPTSPTSSNSSSSKLEDSSSPDVYKIDTIVSEILLEDEALEFISTPQGSPNSPSSIVPMPDIFLDFDDDLGEISADWNF